ncbi:nitrous oxide reductase accessory protein NosL [Seleniivibrio sp.]|uniref:nitrous oxide reductase accessory protein NosL n=1 Tax=Seleniivibrio sp. TaxID=2898801 RepID=UPI0025E9136F|nr:nitrous oxide reductase accessory protein NosL [Seleniivibrio sp.]MCD8552895.1 nitrous oxide reductase accessory protein NosL [Seleniivibrio sp.]
MRNTLIVIALMLSFFAFAGDMADEFERNATGTPELLQKGAQKHWCPVCGMNLPMYYKTNFAVKLKNGEAKQYCSIRCFADDYGNISENIKEILVIDAAKEKFTNAKKAHYVMGSQAPGTMTAVSKYGFASLADAQAFQKKYGGEIVNYDTVLKATLDSMQTDKNMSAEKKAKMVYPMGEKIYKSVCKPVDPSAFEQINAMKAYIKDNAVCGELKEGQLQAVSLYLWEVQRKSAEGYSTISVPEGAKCPVCGMFVAKYPKWAAQITYKDAKGVQNSVYFDGVKDLMKFYQKPEKWGKYKHINITQVFVSDYYSLKAIDGKTAFYVIGSDLYGPMGSELIPFESEQNAKTFMTDHNGKSIVRFSEIKSSMLK